MDKSTRKPTRIPHYDYKTPNYYFITICTHDKKCIFGNPGKLNSYGMIAEEELIHLEILFPSVKIDKYVIMPNHVHCILILEEGNYSVSTCMGLYKSGVSRKIHQLNQSVQVWQRSFHDHIIRNQQAYEKIYMYIENNPQKWKEDCFYSDL